MSNNTNYPYPERTQETTGYQGGYAPQPYPPQQMPPRVYPQSQPLQPQQGYGYPPQPMQPGYPPMQGYPPQQMQIPYPQYGAYPQQMMMMPPQPINVVVNNSNNNANAAIAGRGYVRVRKRGTPILLSLIYLCFIGWWVGFYWVIIGLVLSALGKESGQKMMEQLPMVFFLRPAQSLQSLDRP